MSLLFLYAEPWSFWQGMVIIALMIVGTIVFIAVGGYVFVRIIALVFNSYQGSWESSAKPLGFSIEKTAGGLYKPLVGERNGARISITHFGINPRKSGVDHCALVEVKLSKPLGFSFKLSRREDLLDNLAHFFDDTGGVGHEAFDKIFKVECSDTSALRTLLSVEMMDAESSTILTDLVLAAKKYVRVVLTDSSLSLGTRADFGRADVVEPVIAKAIYLASRVDLAASR